MADATVKRTRRAPEEARARILDAAERRLAAGGPEALRLQDIARDLGISHPAILHHFGNRDGLIVALEERAMTRLQQELLGRLEASAEEGLSRAFATLGEAGHARLLAWQVLRGGSKRARDEAAMMKTLTDAYHQTRTEKARRSGQPLPSYEDTAFWVRLAALALFGEALIGPLLSESARVADPEAVRTRFQTWLAELLDRSS